MGLDQVLHVAEEEIAHEAGIGSVLLLHGRDGVPEQELDLGGTAMERQVPRGRVGMREPLQFSGGDWPLIVGVNIEPFDAALAAIG